MYLAGADFLLGFNKEEIGKMANAIMLKISKTAEQEIESFSGSFEDFVRRVEEEESLLYSIAKQMYGYIGLSFFESSIRINLNGIYSSKNKGG